MENPTHLGDGAYATFNQWGDVVLTANHHDPELATDTVTIDRRGMEALTRWYKELKEKRNEPNL